LKQEKEEVLEKLRVAQKEKNEIRAKFEQNNAKIQEEKDQLLTEQTMVKEAVTKELHSVSAWHRRNQSQPRYASREARRSHSTTSSKSNRVRTSSSVEHSTRSA
jgi:peptidoglycan hydrolase CwlO-like protein